jgi:putative endonuclease
MHRTAEPQRASILSDLALSLERHLYTRLRACADRKSTLPPHLLTGERGEDAAFFHLRSLGYTIVARRWRSQRLRGDLDLVAWDADTLVIFEVKTRTARDLAPAEAEVDFYKQHHLRRMAAAYLAQLPEAHRSAVPVRFDILSVYLLDGTTEFEHFPNAFPRTSQFASRGV